MQASGLLESLQAAVKGATPAREGALLVVAELCQSLGAVVEPFVATALLSTILERYADKVSLASAGLGIFCFLCCKQSCFVTTQ